MSSYATIDQVKTFGVMPAEDVDDLEARYPGVVAANVTGISGQFDASLVKRYAAPFVAPYPDSLIFNVVQVVVLRLYLKRGFNPSSAQDAQIIKLADAAMAWLRDAADSKDGLVELPIRQQTGPSAVNSGGPLAYGEASPYTAMDQQSLAVRQGLP